jgi:hypothetical protein
MEAIEKAERENMEAIEKAEREKVARDILEARRLLREAGNLMFRVQMKGHAGRWLTPGARSVLEEVGGVADGLAEKMMAGQDGGACGLAEAELGL